MTNNDDLDSGWAADWRSTSPAADPAESIRHYVTTRGRRLRWWVAGEWAVAGIALPVVLYIAATTARPVERSAMLGLAAIVVAAMAFSWWNWRGVLRESAATTAVYVELAAQRVRRRRIAWRGAWLMLGVEVAVLAVWISDRVGVPDSTTVVGFAWAWLVAWTGAAVIVLLVTGRWIRRDAERFDSLKRELE